MRKYQQKKEGYELENQATTGGKEGRREGGKMGGRDKWGDITTHVK